MLNKLSDLVQLYHDWQQAKHNYRAAITDHIGETLQKQYYAENRFKAALLESAPEIIALIEKEVGVKA